MELTSNLIEQDIRTYIPKNFELNSWGELESFYKELHEREITSQGADRIW